MAKAATQRRHALGITQQELAELAGVGVSSVRALESGIDTMTMSIVMRILAALGLRLLISGDGGRDAIPLHGRHG